MTEEYLQMSPAIRTWLRLEAGQKEKIMAKWNEANHMIPPILRRKMLECREPRMLQDVAHLIHAHLCYWQECLIAAARKDPSPAGESGEPDPALQAEEKKGLGW